VDAGRYLLDLREKSQIGARLHEYLGNDSNPELEKRVSSQPGTEFKIRGYAERSPASRFDSNFKPFTADPIEREEVSS
jgi:hypothetical protein